MTAHIAAHGRLVVDVQSKTISNGKSMAFTRLAVALPCRDTENGELTFWLAVTAFGRQQAGGVPAETPERRPD